MADGDSRFSPKLIAGAVAVLALVGIFLSTYLGGAEDNTTPPSAAYEALQAGEPLPEGYGLPAQRRGQATKGSSSRLAADEGDTAEPQNDDEDEGQQEKKRRGNRKKKRDRKSKPDEYGVDRFDDGSVDHTNRPPPG